MYTQQELSHADAMRIVQAIQTLAESEGVGLAVAVVDTHGELLAFLRTDGCRLPSITIAQNKAYTAVREQIESKELGRRSREDGFPMTNFGELRYVTWGGGIPIIVDGACVGAVGVSGLPEADDIRFAHHAISAWLG
ncbi:MAG: GlcG/HbpS family heme-binding protein [Anaerolineae bacterium]